jgi:hypothetical protein
MGLRSQSDANQRENKRRLVRTGAALVRGDFFGFLRN